jgi:hypothetical protein|tara:strand:+ start:50 stop:580 length:531 start_codon:yes stop_codon:yes gene_type:complete
MTEMTEIVHKEEDVLKYVHQNRGILWEKIATFREQLEEIEGAMVHKAGNAQSEEMSQVFPLKQTLEGGLYTRELFMPKGSLVVSMIHKQQHPSFLLKGKVSYINDEGEIITVTGPHVIFTQTGTQRVLYIHEDTNWCCVYKTDAKTFEEAEADVYTDDYRDLPDTIIIQKRKLCLE